jgi:hypothetical protein
MYPDPTLNWQALDADPDPYSNSNQQPYIFALLFYSVADLEPDPDPVG